MFNNLLSGKDLRICLSNSSMVRPNMKESEKIMATFEKIKAIKRYEDVIKQIKKKISSGELKPGDHLPPERELAELMSVSRASVREALKVLEYMGLIESKPKEGTSIAFVQAEVLDKKLTSVFENKNYKLINDLLEMRQVMEPKIIEFAIIRASDQEISQIEDSFQLLTDIKDEELNTKADAIFHLAIAKASHNEFFIELIKSILDMMVEIRRKNISLSADRKIIVIKEHREILLAIKRRNKEEAVEACTKHLSNIRAFIEEHH